MPLINAAALADALDAVSPDVLVRVDGDDIAFVGKTGIHRLDAGSSSVARVTAHYLGYISGLGLGPSVATAESVVRALGAIGVRAYVEVRRSYGRPDVGDVIVCDDVLVVHGTVDPHAIERIDDRGMIRAHLTRDGVRTVCGLRLVQTQPHPAHGGNAMCKRCQALAPRTV